MGRIITVSKETGSRITKIGDAVKIAVAGDYIDVMPGIYRENNLMKAGLTINFQAGAVINYTDPGVISSSTTSLTMGTGTKTLTVLPNLVLQAGDFVSINLQSNTTDPDFGGADWTSNAMIGTVTSYSGTTLVANITSVSGGGTFAKWWVFGPGYGIFDDRAPGAGGGDFTVTGALEMIYRHGNPGNLFHSLGAVVVNNAATKLKFTGTKATLAAPTSLGGNTTFGVFSLKNVKDGSFVNMDEITDSGETWSNLDATTPTTGAGGGGGFYWEKGELNINCRRNTMQAGYALWCHEPNGGVATNLYYTGQLMSDSFSCFYTDSNSSNYRVWVTCQQMIGKGIGLSLIGPAKIYVDCQKLIADLCVSASSNVVLWLRAEKLSATNIGGGTVQWMLISSSEIYATVQHYEDVGGAVANGIDVSGASSYVMINGGRMKNGASGSALGLLRHQAGVTRITGALIDGLANNAAGNSPVTVSGAGLTMAGCTILAGTNATASINAGSAQTVKFTGTTIATKAVSVNVTQQPVSSVVVDASAGP